LIYSFCNIDDVSWGTKGCTDSGKNIYYEEKIKFILGWMFGNSIMSWALIQLFNGIEDKGWMIMAIGIYGTVIISIKFLFAAVHHIWFYLKLVLVPIIAKIYKTNEMKYFEEKYKKFKE
jgi:chitin synthase